MSTCEHWIDGRCSQDLFGGFPKPYQCESCNRYAGPDRGLGDKVHRAIVTIAGKRIAGSSGCECGRRRAYLNRLSRNKE